MTKYITQGANYVNGVPEENKDAAVDLFFAVEENVMMEEGQSQSFAVRGIPAGLDLAMEWSVSDDAVLSVDEAGTVTALAIGNAEVYVKLLGETYTSTVRVVAATPENVLFSAAYEGTRGNLSQSSGLFEDYIAAADVPEIKGDYDGTAARFTEGQASRKYLLSLGHVSVEELAEYDYVSLWFAFQCNTEAESDAATYMAVLGDTNNLVGNYYQANTNLPKNTWVQLYIPIDQLIELRQADETVVLFDFWSEKGSSTMMKFCIGDIVLEKAADDILFSAGDPFTSGNIGIDAGNGISMGETYADASQIEGIAGEYTGAALQFVSDGGAGTKAYYLDIGKTAEELREYSYVKLTFAATPADQTGVTHGCSMGTDSLLGYFKKDSGNIWNLPKNQWIEEQIPVETLIDFMNGESRIKIFALYGESMNQLPSLPSFYIGDIVLVK